MGEETHIGRILSALVLVILVSGCDGDGSNDPPPLIDDAPEALTWDAGNWDEGVWQ